MAWDGRILLIGGAGYIGSYLHRAFQRNGFSVDICDIAQRGSPLGPAKYRIDYNSLDAETLASYSTILWFAGHSSVRSALDDPFGALMNNCINLVALRRKTPLNVRLIYASTASLYSAPIDQFSCPASLSREEDSIIPGINAYDTSKFCFDYIAKGFLSNFIGLRMGTVSGYSPNLRPELIFNAMNLSAIRSGEVKVANAAASRSLLFLDDLYKVLAAIIAQPDLSDGFINVASLNATVGEIAEAIARFHGVDIKVMPDAPTYSFRLDTSKATQCLGVALNGDLMARCRDFLAEYEENMTHALHG